MARRPARGSSGSRAGGNGRSGGGRSGGGSRGGRGRSGGGSNNSAMYIGIGAVVIVIVAVVAFMGGGDKPDEGPAKIDQNIETAKKKEPSADELWKKNGKAEPEKAESDKRWGSKWKTNFNKSEFRDAMKKVDRTIWNEVEELFVEARKLKVKAQDARKAGNEEEFAKLMGEAVRTWRKGDLKSELFSESVELIKEDMWDAMFKDEQKKLERLTKEFRGYLMFENK